MEPTARLEQRLTWIEPDHFERGQTVHVIEKSQDGAGTATFLSPAKNQLLRFNLSEVNRLRFIKQRRVADGVLVELSNDGLPLRLHLIELKSGLTLSDWNKVKQQLLGALHNAHALMGLLGLPMPDQIECHTCYRRDRISPQDSAHPVLFKPGVGTRIEDHPAYDWINGYCELSSDFPRLPHHRHQRDEQGNAEIAL
ncbi:MULTISPECIES: hypothetical protein [unclassified Ectothiorhodospira]|uniref:hypothetical protein n=1 Tax=unclassified Ectothiorhodospira TaxID=2684909 RepID=UPI001EE7F2DC|nr:MULTISPECIES: hypothetical protein [unclassified Ectothiorhodospira]MCG5516382.1 hypothetical protein [Ectothiorhodospira sp. 9100]MCG5519368.1 hypothetical protein [Ectothiorhodospira sp. 9905]